MPRERKVVSRSSSVDPSKVGTTRPGSSPSSSPRGETRVHLGTVEAKWDCAACGHLGNPGGTKVCAACGKPKMEEIYQPPAADAPYLTLPQMQSMGVDPIRHESDEVCTSCGAHNPPGTQLCKRCGSPIEKAARTARTCSSCGRSTNELQCPTCGSATVSNEPEPLRMPFDYSGGQPAYQPTYRSSLDDIPQAPTFDWRKIGFIAAGVAAVMAVVAAAVFFLWPRQETATVTSTNWTATVFLEEYRNNQHEGWSLPAQDLLNSGQAVKLKEESKWYKNISVPDRIENQCHNEQVSDGYTTVQDPDERVCESVYDHTDTTCYDDGTCDKDDVYKDECHSESRSHREEQFHSERVCADVQLYRDEPVFASWYTYTIWEWTSVASAVQTGSGPEVYYPRGYTIDATHREAGRSQVFSLTFTVGENTYTYTPSSLEEYLRYPQGTTWVIVRNGRNGGISEIKPIEAK